MSWMSLFRAKYGGQREVDERPHHQTTGNKGRLHGGDSSVGSGRLDRTDVVGTAKAFQVEGTAYAKAWKQGSKFPF